jgi:hypothetical protein
MNEVTQAVQPEFPAILVEYARGKLKTDRVLVDYLAQFGDRFEKGEAQMILDAAGDKNGK